MEKRIASTEEIKRGAKPTAHAVNERLTERYVLGRIAGKVWGKTELILANPSLEFHRIDADAGTRCSRHRHKYKFNAFYVVEGTMIIRVWKNDYDLVDETVLGPGDFTEVKPGEDHQFEAVESCIAFELYYAHFDHNDIEREDVGGPVEP